MRMDKFLKVSRIIKRRSVAADAADANRVFVGGKAVKPSYNVKIGDTVTIKFGDNPFTFRVLSLNEKAGKGDAGGLYEIVEG